MENCKYYCRLRSLVHILSNDSKFNSTKMAYSYIRESQNHQQQQKNKTKQKKQKKKKKKQRKKQTNKKKKQQQQKTKNKNQTNKQKKNKKKNNNKKQITIQPHQKVQIITIVNCGSIFYHAPKISLYQGFYPLICFSCDPIVWASQRETCRHIQLLFQW